MITRETSIEINRPVEDVFTTFADTRHQPHWDPGLIDVHLMPDGPVGVGTKVTELRKFMGRTSENTGEVIEFEPNVRITRKTAGGPMLVVGTITFTTAPLGTQVSWRWDLNFSGLFSLIGPLIANGMHKGAQTSLHSLKNYLESENAPAFSVSGV